MNFLKQFFIGISSALILLTVFASPPVRAGELYVGGGAKAGEITDTTAIVLIRLTSTPEQTDDGTIPGTEGQVRVHYGHDKSLRDSQVTSWRAVVAEEDHSVQFKLTGLPSGQRLFYRAEMRVDENAPTSTSEVSSFITAPASDVRAPVMFHLTTCQDIHGESTYRAMTDQRPDFCISAGDTVYYDGQGQARNVPQAWKAYQKMFGLPAMKDYYRHVGGYYMKDDHDYRFNDADPYMKGKWVTGKKADLNARFTETKGNQKLDVAWLTHEEGIRVFKQVFPMDESTYRSVRWGKGLQLWMLEHRDFRSPNNMPDGPDKSIWGKDQKSWLMKTLLSSDADYRVIVAPNPIVGPDRLMKGDNHANLNGFWHEAQEFLDWLKDNKLNNVIVMCGDRHWQYHSIDHRNGRNIHEFSCGPTSDDHTQAVPPLYEDVLRPYSASRGGFVSVRYQPDDRSLKVQYFSMKGAPLYDHVFKP